MLFFLSGVRRVLLSRSSGGGRGSLGREIRVLRGLGVRGVALTPIRGVVLVVEGVTTALVAGMEGVRVVAARVGIGDGLRGARWFDDY